MAFKTAALASITDVSSSTAWLDSGVGMAALILTVIIHAVLMGKWSARVEAQVEMLRVDIPDLRKHRHDTSIILAEHTARLLDNGLRLDSNTRSIAEVRAEIGVLVRLDERIGSIQARLAKIEESLDRFRDH